MTFCAALASAQTTVRDVENPDHFPLQVSAPLLHVYPGVAVAGLGFAVNIPGRRYVIEHVNVQCTFEFESTDRLAEAVLTIFDANNIAHQYELVINQVGNQTPDPYAQNLSLVSEAIRTYHDGGPAGTNA